MKTFGEDCKEKFIEMIKTLSKKYEKDYEDVIDYFRTINYEVIIEKLDIIKEGDICCYKSDKSGIEFAKNEIFVVTKVYYVNNELFFDAIYGNRHTITDGKVDLITKVDPDLAFDLVKNISKYIKENNV